SSVLLALFTLTLLPIGALAQDALVPERYATTHSDTDYPGGDLQAIFDISLERCHAACLGDDDCLGFTFDQRNNVCFLKDTLGEPVLYVDAFSGTVATRSDEAAELARAAAADLGFL